jgi:AraC-like DNA-binding protein
MRQELTRDYDPPAGVSISTLAYDYPAGFDVAAHAHGADQVIYAPRGVMEVSAGRSVWLIPPQFAVWIPARTTHRIRMPEAVSMRTLYLRRGLAARLPRTCKVLHVSILLRELIVEAVRIGRLRADDRLHTAIRDLLVHLLHEASPVPMFVTLPTDARALAVAERTMASQRVARSLPALCAGAGASVRTVQRAFRREVGLSFEQWRRQVRLMKGVELLVAGRSVKEVAYLVGYRQPSAFVEMFRRTMGIAPKAWIAAFDDTPRRGPHDPFTGQARSGRLRQ